MAAPVFVSRRTISSRLKALDQVLTSLFQQTHRADRVILNISLDAYMLDEGIMFEQLPVQTRELVTSGQVELYYCRNIGPYRKIIPVLDRFGCSDYYVAVADDDVIYPPEWLEVLHATAEFNGCIAGYRCRRMKFSATGFQAYRDWQLLNDSHTPPSRDLLPTGRDGVIYHASHLSDREILEHLRRLAPAQDDIALRFATLLRDVPVAIAPRAKTSSPNGHEFPGVLDAGQSLWVINYGSANDTALEICLRWVRQHHAGKFLM